MANAEHLEILGKGVTAWNEWRKQRGEVIPDLSGANLMGVSLSGFSLYDTNLINADLSGAALDEANLVGAVMAHSKLRGAHLNRAELSSADLTGADLSGADLASTNLVGANLADANLQHAVMFGANLNRADLTRADLSGADLCGADLSRSDLTKTVLTGADLTDADLSEANVANLNLSKAIFGFTVFGDLDLSSVRGLDTAHHHGPSTIGLDTFFASKGKIPEAFLRGAGVPEIFIQSAATFIDSPIQFYSCFISYSHADMAFARRLHDALQDRGIRCWLDEKQLLPGDQIHRAVDEAVRLWDKLLLCCSKASLTSWWVDKEVQKALIKEEQFWKERGKEVLAIIPLNLDGYMLDPQWQDWKEQHLSARLAADFTGWEKDNAKFDEQFERVVRALRADGGTREKPPKPLL